MFLSSLEKYLLHIVYDCQYLINIDLELRTSTLHLPNFQAKNLFYVIVYKSTCMIPTINNSHGSNLHLKIGV